MSRLATVLIAARNAALTIERAIASACAQGDCSILLVDDLSADDTVFRAHRVAGNRLRVVRLAVHQTLGITRQTGLMAVKTPYGMWLDADDELLPGRLERMVEVLETESADLVSDGVELFDGPTGNFRKLLPIPDFLRHHHPLARLFERNYLPAPGAVAFRTHFARRIGYDPRLHGAEDFDFLLRAIAGDARFRLLESEGYRLYAYPESLSRRIENQRQMCSFALHKHAYEDVRMLYYRAGYDDRIACWGLVSMAMFRGDYRAVLELLGKAEELIEDPDAVLEPEGPCAYPERWRVAFFRATALLLFERPTDALRIFEGLIDEQPSAAVCNNFGVAKWKTGDRSGARLLFGQGVQLLSDYFDAKSNLESPNPNRITTHPLRAEPARMDYAKPDFEARRASGRC